MLLLLYYYNWYIFLALWFFEYQTVMIILIFSLYVYVCTNKGTSNNLHGLSYNLLLSYNMLLLSYYNNYYYTIFLYLRFTHYNPTNSAINGLFAFEICISNRLQSHQVNSLSTLIMFIIASVLNLGLSLISPVSFRHATT